MTGPKLNEQPVLRSRPDGPARKVAEAKGGSGSRSVARYVRVSAYKVREVLDLVRGQDAERAQEILQFCERDAATLVGKVLRSAVANAEHNDGINPEELYVSACYADEGPTLKRWRPRARGRATRIRKRTCHVTLIVSRLPESELRKRRAAKASTGSDRRRRRGGAAAERGPSPERDRRVRASRRQQPEPETQAAAPVVDEEPTAMIPEDAPEPDVEVEDTETTTADTDDEETE
ncbi:MAG: 50S ribosomal protein L22 [Acidimicrobiales bacterium]